MSAEKAGSKQQRRANAKFFPVDTATLSNVLVALSLLWQIISMLSNTGIVVIILYLWKQNDDAYKRFPVRSYAGNNLANYGGNPRDGYLEESNVPKQVLAMGFISIFYLGLLIMVFILGVVDLCLISEIARGIARSLRVTGLNLSEYSEQQSVIAIALLKLWVGVCVGSQSFIAFGEGNGFPQELGSPRTWHGRFIVTCFVWAYCLNGLIYIATTYVCTQSETQLTIKCLARRLMTLKKHGLKGFFVTHRQKEEMLALANGNRYNIHKGP